MTELIDQSLTSLSFLHDSLLVILAKGPRELVIIHSWTILNEIQVNNTLDKLSGTDLNAYLSLAPESCHLDRVDDLEDPLLPVDPVDVVAVCRGLQEQLLDKLPEVNVSAGPPGPGAGPGGRLAASLTVIILLVWRKTGLLLILDEHEKILDI